MTSTAFDVDVDFETEEETSEFEDGEESISTVTIKLPLSTVSPASKPVPAIETSASGDTSVAKIRPGENERALSDEIPTKKSAKVKSSKESIEKIVENGHDLKPAKSSRSETRAEEEGHDEDQVESKANKFPQKSKADPDACVEESSSRKHKSERRKSKEEKKKDLQPAVDAGDEVAEVGGKKGSKSKKEKNHEPDESGRKRDKSQDEEGQSSKGRKDKHDRTGGVDEVPSLLLTVGEASEVKEKVKTKKKKSSDQDGKSLEQSLPSPSSELEKSRADMTHENKPEEDQADEEVKVVKAVKKKSKKPSALQPERDDQAPEAAEVTGFTDEPAVEEKKTTASTPPDEEVVDRSEEVKRAEREEAEDADQRGQLAVTASRPERDRASPDCAFTGRIEQTRNYLKALTPEDCCRSQTEAATREKESEKEEDQTKRDDAAAGAEPAREPSPEPIERGGRIVENEDSDFTYRRKSMDEFIKKILAEAREENQKLKEDTEKAGKPPRPSKRQSPDDETRGKKSRTIKPPRDDCGGDDDDDGGSGSGSKELADIDEYFSKRREESERIEERRRQSPESSAVAGNGRTRRDQPSRLHLHPPSGADREGRNVSPGKRQKPQATLASSKKPHETKHLMNGDAFSGRGREDEEEEEEEEEEKEEQAVPDIADFLSKFKRERHALFGGGRYEPEVKRSAETEEMIKEKTRSIKSVIDQQVDICHNVRAVSKQLDDLEKELREVRQISLDRRNRMEAMENAVNAEYKMYEIEHQAAADRVNNKKPLQKFTQEVKDQMIASIQQQARSKKGERYRGESNSESDAPFASKRRVGSVSSQAGLADEQDGFFLNSTSTSPYHSFASSKGRGSSSDRDQYLSSFLTVDRRRDGSGAGSRSRLSFIDGGADFDDMTSPSMVQSSLFSKPKSRASVATMDTSASISADDFLSKMRSKYSFLNPAQAGDDVSSRLHSTSRNSGASGYRSLTSVSGGHDPYRSRLEEQPLSSSYLSVRSIGGRGPSPGSLHDLPGSRYSLASSGSGGRYSGLGGSTLGSYEPQKSRRASSVADVRSSVHYDRHLGGYTTGSHSGYGGSSAGSSRYSYGGSSKYSDASSHLYAPSHSSSGSEFKSRFLDKVREKRSSVGSSSSSSHDLADRVKARLSRQVETAEKPTAEAK